MKKKLSNYEKCEIISKNYFESNNLNSNSNLISNRKNSDIELNNFESNINPSFTKGNEIKVLDLSNSSKYDNSSKLITMNPSKSIKLKLIINILN